MQTTYELALNEFRDASAAVRRAFGAVAEARELQIIADSQHRRACNEHAEAVRRLEAADAALMEARSPNAPTAPPEPVARVTQAEVDAMAEPAWNGAAPADQPLHIG
jgi:hypothetical protein